MPNSTTNLGLNIFLEHEVVDFEQINENFEKVDSLVSCVESGTKTSTYNGVTTGAATWRYKKYSDGTIDMSTKLEFSNVKCNGGDAAPYYSGTSTLYLPFSLSQVYDVQMHMASSTPGWVNDTTAHAVVDSVKFLFRSMTVETDYVFKQVFINVKGVLA